jgi:hypothetical protein
MLHLIAAFVAGAIVGAGAILYLVRHDRLDAKKAADELAEIAAKAKRP